MKICNHGSCIDEYIGVAGVTFSVLFYLIQFAYTSETFNISSFSIYAIFFAILSEALFCIQGIYKNSPTIIITRSLTTIRFTYLLLIWIYKYYKNLKRQKTR